MEKWKDIKGYEGYYQISNLGRIKSLPRDVGSNRCKKETIMKTSIDKDGYEHLVLCKDGKQKHFRVNRLVAQAFIPNPNNYPVVNHKDENKTNNDVKNLEWCTNEYNHNYGTRNERVGKSLSKKVICITTGEIFNSMREACRKYNISSGSMTECCQGKRKTAGGYKWEYFKEEI